MTIYTKRVTAIVREDYIEQANELALVLGMHPDDVYTFRNPCYTDGTHLYSVASWVCSERWLEGLNSPLQAPSHAPDADLDLAQQALDARDNGVYLVVQDNTLEKPQLPLWLYMMETKDDL